MSDELLERAAAVLRERYDGKAALPERTEALVLLRVQPRAARRQWLPIVAIPLVASLLASVAWGIATGKLALAVHAVRGARASDRAPAARSAQPRSMAVATSAAVPELAPSATSALEPDAIVHVPPLSRPHARVQRSIPAEPSAEAVATPPLAPSPDALFRIANRAQFSGHHPAQAVALWDRYLSAAPNGSLTPEARYNRAIALARSGRKAEAAVALRPFARGDYGTYRQTEAQQLLKVLAQ